MYDIARKAVQKGLLKARLPECPSFSDIIEDMQAFL